MKKWTLILLTTVLTVLTTVFGLIYLSRVRLEYNIEGNYLDKTSGVVYHEQAVLFFGTISIVLLLLTILTALTAVRQTGN